MVKFRIIIYSIVVILISSSLFSFSVKATEVPHFGTWFTAYPSSYYSSYAHPLPKSLSHGTAIDTQYFNDSSTRSISFWGYEYYNVKTQGFANDLYYGNWDFASFYENITFLNGDYFNSVLGGGHIYNNATVKSVWAVAVFNSGSINVNNLYFSISTDNGNTWSSYQHPYYQNMMWTHAYLLNITSYRTWTPAMLKSNNTIVSLNMYGNVGQNYILDYSGLYYNWYLENYWIPDWRDYDVENNTNGENYTTAPDYNYEYPESGNLAIFNYIIPIFAVVGFSFAGSVIRRSGGFSMQIFLVGIIIGISILVWIPVVPTYTITIPILALVSMLMSHSQGDVSFE